MIRQNSEGTRLNANVILAFGVLGMIFGSLAAMRESHIKRMLAYSSVAQIGYIFMGIGLGSAAGLVASCFQDFHSP